MPTSITSSGITFNDSTSLTSGTIGTSQVSSTVQKQFCKAWINFDGTGTATTGLSATWAQSGTTVTVTTSSAHGIVVGQQFYSTAPQVGVFTVLAVTSATVFTYTTTTTATNSGSSTIYRNVIRSSFNVSSITKNGTGDYTVNFATPMDDASYSIGVSSKYAVSSASNNWAFEATPVSTTSARVLYPAASDFSTVSVQIFGN